MFDASFTGVLHVFYRCVTGVCVQTVEEEERGWTDIPGVHRLQGLIHSFAGIHPGLIHSCRGVCYRCFTGVLQVFYGCVTGV